jgi:heat shock protein HslJ
MRRLVQSKSRTIVLCIATLLIISVLPGCTKERIPIPQQLSELSLVKIWQSVEGATGVQNNAVELESFRLLTDTEGKISGITFRLQEDNRQGKSNGLQIEIDSQGKLNQHSYQSKIPDTRHPLEVLSELDRIQLSSVFPEAKEWWLQADFQFSGMGYGNDNLNIYHLSNGQLLPLKEVVFQQTPFCVISMIPRTDAGDTSPTTASRDERPLTQIWFLSEDINQAERVEYLETAPSKDELDGSQWRLTSIENQELVSDSYISLYFMQGNMWGYSGLNNYEGDYKVVTPGILDIYEMITTLIGGPEDIIQQERNYLTSLRDSPNYKLADNRLEFYAASGGRLLVLERLPEYPMNPSDLVGTKWEVVSLDGEPVSAELNGTLEFESDRAAIGEAGRYVTRLDYQAEGDSIHIEGTFSTRRDILGENRVNIQPALELEKQAAQFTSSLAFATNYRLSTDRLELFTTRGGILIFKPLL